MVGASCFTLEPPNDGSSQVARATGPAGAAQEAGLRGAGAAGLVPTPPWFTHATDLGTYNQPWVADTEVTVVAKLAKECGFYCDAFTGNPVDCLAIITSILSTANGMVLLVVLSGYQV